jgi:hypothetical protein
MERLGRQSDTHIGFAGWAVSFGTAIAFDLLADQTMSQWYRERVHDPRTKPLALGLLALSAYHLTRPDKYPYQQLDPITQLGTAIKRVV